MKILALFLSLFFVGISTNVMAQQTADPLKTQPDSTSIAAERAARTAAARKYVAVVNVKEMVDRMGNGLANAAELTGDERVEFVKYVNTTVNIANLEDMVLNATINYFTVPEIEALTAFHSTPEGKKIMAKMGAYLNDLMPAIQQEVVAVVQRRASQR